MVAPLIVPLKLDKKFHPTLYDGRDYLSILGLNLIHVGKKGADVSKRSTNTNPDPYAAKRYS